MAKNHQIALLATIEATPCVSALAFQSGALTNRANLFVYSIDADFTSRCGSKTIYAAEFVGNALPKKNLCKDCSAKWTIHSDLRAATPPTPE